MEYVYTIYQVKRGLTREFGYIGLRERKLFLGTTDINMDVYEEVYNGTLEGKSPNRVLEKLFTMFNTNHPSDYTGRSMSVSDIVKIDDGLDTRYYYCDSFEWEEIVPAGELV